MRQRPGLVQSPRDAVRWLSYFVLSALLTWMLFEGASCAVGFVRDAVSQGGAFPPIPARHAP